MELFISDLSLHWFLLGFFFNLCWFYLLTVLAICADGKSPGGFDCQFVLFTFAKKHKNLDLFNAVCVSCLL